MKSRSNKLPYIIGGLVILMLGIILYPILFAPAKELRYPDIIKSPDMNSNVVAGQNLNINFNEVKLKSHDSIVLRLNNSTLTTLRDNYSYELSSTGLPLGYHKLEVTVYKNEASKTIDLPFVVVSDITPVNIPFTKLNTIPHDPKSYTQGIEIFGGMIYESAGNYGVSSIRQVNIKNGTVIKNKEVSKEFFAEGLTIMDGKVYQLTWKEGICIVYDEALNELEKKAFRTNGEGWGLCNDGKSLIISDGSNMLTYVNPNNFKTEKVLHVYAGSTAVNYLNELEYVDGFIYANIYTTNQIAKIEASSGKVLGVLELENLKNENQDGEVLNGIAYKSDTKTFLVTGKHWKNMYEIKF